MIKLAHPICIFSILMMTLFGFSKDLKAQSSQTKSLSSISIKKAGDKTQIQFTLAKQSDVEIAILNSKGTVIRHLAAGVLGGEKNPPAPLVKGLTQKLTWNGLDDFKKKATNGPYKVRVRTGLQAKLGRLFGSNLYSFGVIDNIATDEAGNVYVEANVAASQGVNTVRAYNPDGTYQRTVLPFASNLKPGAMKDVARWDNNSKAWYTRNLSDLDPEFYFAKNAKHPNDYTLFSASKSKGISFISNKFFHQLNSDTSVKGSTFKGRSLWDKKWLNFWNSIPNTGRGLINVALTPDGKYLYLTGVQTKDGKPDIKSVRKSKGHNFFPMGSIWRMNLTDPAGTMQLFSTIKSPWKGNWRKGGVDSGKLSSPLHGITIDHHNNVYVCDREHDCIAVFDEKAKRIATLPINSPDFVAVHPKTNEIYVISKLRIGHYRYKVSLVKFQSFKDGTKVLATLPLKMSEKGTSLKMALSFSGTKTKIWLANVVGGIAAIEDQGKQFKLIKTAFQIDKKAQVSFARIAVDYKDDTVYLSNGYNLIWKYDGKTGQGKLLEKNGKPYYAVDLTVGYHGNLLVRSGASYSGPLERLDKNLKPLPYKSGTHVLSKYIYGRYGTGFCEKGVAAGPDGSVYNMSMYGWQKYSIIGFNPDGTPMNGQFLKNKIQPANYKKGLPKALKNAIIGPLPAANGGVRVDLDGNFYVGMHVLPEQHKTPKAFAKDKTYNRLTASVVKFTKSGGAVSGLPDYESGKLNFKLPVKSRYSKKIKSIEGATNIYPGISPFSGTYKSCVCRVSRFDLDRYGRLALPSAMTSSVRIVDNAGNHILTFGKYGNFDSQFSPKDATSKEPIINTPEIPMNWPTGVGFSENHLYICETGNRRAIRIDWQYKTETTLPIK